MNNNLIFIFKYLLSRLKQNPFRFILVCVVIGLSVSLIISVKVASRESVKTFNALGDVLGNVWNYEIRHVSGKIPERFITDLSYSSIKNFVIAKEELQNINSKNIRILSIIGSTLDPSIYKFKAKCVVKENINYDCKDKYISKNLSYDVIRISESDYNSNFIAVFDNISESTIKQLNQSGFIIESFNDKKNRANNITKSYRENLEFVLFLAFGLTCFLVFASSLHNFRTLQSNIITFKTLGASRSSISIISLLDSLLSGITGGIIGTTLFYPLTKFLSNLYFVSSQAHHQVGITQATFNLNISDITAGFLVSILTASIGNLILTFKLISTKPSLSPKFSDTVNLNSNKSNYFLLILFLISALLSTIPYFFPKALFAYIAGVTIFICAGIAAFFSLKLLVNIFRTNYFSHKAHSLFALSSLQSEPFRFGVSTFSFCVGITFLIGLSIFISSFRLTLVNWMEYTFNGDIYIRDDSGKFDTNFLTTVTNRENYSWIIDNREIDIPFKDTKIKLQIIPLKDAIENKAYQILNSKFDFNKTDYSIKNTAIISEVLANKFKLEIGDTINLIEKDFLIAGIYKDFASERGAVLIDKSSVNNQYSSIPVKSLTIKLKDSSMYNSEIDFLNSFNIPTIVTFNPDTLKSEALRIFDDTFRITWFIQIIVFAVCLINILLSFMQDIETRERIYATLRLIGVKTSEFIIIILTIAILIGFSSLIAGIVSGIALAHLITNIINPISFGWTLQFNISLLNTLFIPFLQIVLILILIPAFSGIALNRIKKSKVTVE